MPILPHPRVGDVEAEDRYSRFRLIPWWSQEKIAATRVLVVGAGALGNEILKNLGLLGFGKIAVIDLDRVEVSNLSRCVLFRNEDTGRFKSSAVAASMKQMFFDVEVHPLAVNVMYECGLGLFGWADIILAGLDNREARLWINRAAWKMNRPWIDGAIEGINGVARVFLPGKAPCYECTLGATDWALLERRMSCNLLSREVNTEGKVPTTPTISSVIAGIQVQEAVKLIHGLPTLAGHGYIFEGLNHSSYVVEYTENASCMSHYTLEKLVELPCASGEMTLRELWQRAGSDFNNNDVLVEFSREIIENLRCPRCGRVQDVFSPVGTLSVDDGICPSDGAVMHVNLLHSYAGQDRLGDRKLNELGLPLFDVFTARHGNQELAYVVTGDAPEVLGPLAAKEVSRDGKAEA
jgi:adenylyltransferase/sulfurtransferase